MTTHTTTQNKMKTLLLFSGGIDSTVILADLIKKKREVHTITFRYGQTHPIEIQKAALIAQTYNVPNTIVDVPIPKNKTFESTSKAFTPARNIIFLSIALNYAINHNINTIAIGVNKTDESGFPDCTKPFIQSFRDMIKLASPANIHIETPLIELEKHQIVALGSKLNVDFKQTHTCYTPINGKACGTCEACNIRKNAFKLNNTIDETLYA